MKPKPKVTEEGVLCWIPRPQAPQVHYLQPNLATMQLSIYRNVNQSSAN